MGGRGGESKREASTDVAAEFVVWKPHTVDRECTGWEKGGGGGGGGGVHFAMLCSVLE